VSYIPKFGDASKSPVGDAASPAASPSGDAVISHWRCIISFRDAHPPYSHPHLQSAGYVTLLEKQGIIGIFILHYFLIVTVHLQY